MKALARWFALAAIALSLSIGGEKHQTPDDAAGDDEPHSRRSSWRHALPLLQKTPEPPTTTVPGTIETVDPCLEESTPRTAPSAESLGSIGTLEEEQTRFFKAVGEELIAPGYAAFAATTQALATTTQDYCAVSGSSDAAALQGAWKCAMTAWQRVQHLRTGPVEENSRRLRIQLFPDSNNAVQRNLRGLLDGTDAITEEIVRNTPAGAQGFPALEQLIFGSEALSAGSRRCQAAMAIADNLRTMANEVATPWQASGSLLTGFVNGDEPFLSRNGVLIAILESLVVQAEFLADRKIRPALRTRDAEALESPLAGFSRDNIVANLNALAALVDDAEAGTYRLRDYLLRAHDEQPIGDQLAAATTEAQELIAAMTGSFEAIVAQQATADQDRLQELFEAFQQLSDLGVDASVAAGVNLGFNSEDGD